MRVGTLFFCLMLAAPSSGAQSRPVLLDVDPGIDDALAILLAVRSPEIRVEGITVVAGNVEVDLGLQNALKVLELAGRTDIPVARGAAKPLLGKLTTAKLVHGQNGLGNLELPEPRARPYDRGAVDLIASRVEVYPGEITLIPVGPLTNIALALKTRPDLALKIKEIVLMGGSASGGNITPAAEFNIYNDPEAAQIVFDSGVPIVMVGLDVTLQTVLHPAYLEGLNRSTSPLHRFVWGLTDYSLSLARSRGGEGIVLHDPLAVGVAIDPSFVETRDLRVDVETRGERTRGETVVVKRGFLPEIAEGPEANNAAGRRAVQPNARVCLGVASDRFVRFFVERVLGSPAGR